MVFFTRKQINSLLSVVGATVVLGSLYQNCSKVSVADLASEEKALQAERLALGMDEETVTAGMNPVPDLKMFFVVDNSGTMKENQLNLSASFGAMFDQGSADSLSKFDTTAYLLSTAQKSPSLSLEQAVLKQIVAKQKPFNDANSVSLADFNNLYRSSTSNSGLIPGDNIGFHLTSTANPTQYLFEPAPVLGAEGPSTGPITFNRAIRKLASESPMAMEAEFKERLKVLDSERIPLVLDGGKYKPENASIVDAESGLCAVARVLRNPAAFMKAGDLLSFVIVSDEDDNDPNGNNCVQSYKEYTGTEDLVDGICKRKETAFSYATTSTSKAADTCNLNGQKGYQFKISYPNVRYTTTVTYKVISKAAQYSLPVTTLTYSSKSFNYKYLHTNISYYYETCTDVVSDGLVVGKKCTVNATPANGSAAGDFTGDCYGLAKSLNPNAVDLVGKTPVCTTAYKTVPTCNVSDNKCQSTPVYTDHYVFNVLGSLSPSQCLTKAKTYSDFATETVPSCVTTPESRSSCTTTEINAGCVKIADAIYGTKTLTPLVDLTTTSTGCFDWAKTQPENAVSVATDVSCFKNTINETLYHYPKLTFTFTQSVDGGSSLPIGDCGPLKSLAIAEAKKAKPQITDSDVCKINGYYNASQLNKNLITDCDSQALERCTAEGLRSCSGSLVVGATTNTVSGPVAFKTVQENLNCSSKCSDSVLGICNNESSSAQTISDYIKKLYGPTAACSATPKALSIGSEVKTALLLSDEAKICKPSLEGIPSYYTRIKGPYHLVSTEIDYVTGTVKESGIAKPKTNLIDYIRNRSSEISQLQPIFATIVRKPTDPLGLGGSPGLEYLKLVNNGSGGQVESVLSSDYSVVLKDLGKVLKSKLERSFVLQKMQPHQVITRVYHIAKGNNNATVEVPKTQWSQSGATLSLSKDLDFADGDQFRVEFQNYLK